MPAAARVEVEVEGRRLSLSNLDKVLYPAVGFTKGQVIDYYTRVAPFVLPHLRDRPLTLKRYPNGVEGQYFYEKRCPSHAPEWVRREQVDKIEYCVCDELPTLVWLANLADLELHPSLSKVDEILRPTVMAFDLDPGDGAGLPECCEVAFLLRDALGKLGLESFAKTSGSKGIQVYVPLNVEDVDYDHGTKPLSKALARHLEAQHPKLIVSQQKKELRSRQGADRLEPERRAQDDRGRVLAAGAGAADGVHPARVGGARGPVRARVRVGRRAGARRARMATCSRPVAELRQELPDL